MVLTSQLPLDAILNGELPNVQVASASEIAKSRGVKSRLQAGWRIRRARWFKIYRGDVGVTKGLK